MNPKTFLRVCLLMLVGVVGILFFTLQAQPGAESVARQQAIQAFAPAGDRIASDVEQPNLQSSPVSVNLKDIPAGVYDPNNQRDRWLRGEIDLDELDGIRSVAELAVLRQEAMFLPPMGEALLQTNEVAANVPSPSVSFDSIDYTECCGGGGNVPPDPELAVGPNHAIAVVNVAFEIYDKSGNSLVGPTTFASFMASDPECTGVFDPNALYDEEADRFILGIDADGTDYCLAVSQTGDPTGSWFIYSFDTVDSPQEFFDYPHAGVGRNAIYMGANIFTTTFLESRVWAFDKSAMYAGATTTAVRKDLGSNEDTPQPLNLHGWSQGTWPTSGPHYILTETGYNGADHTIWSWDDPFGSNVLSAAGSVDLNVATGVTAGLPIDSEQPTGNALQGNDWRPQDFEYRNGSGWTSMTISCNPGNGTVNCVRWAEINLGTMSVVQAGVYGTDGDYRTFADLAVNHCGDMAIGYTKSNSSSVYPSVYYNGRLGTDSLGTLQTETVIKSGEIEYTAFDTAPHRWGDYTEMTVDPDGETFWYLGEYSKNTGTSDRWGTWIAQVDLGVCDADVVDPPTPTPTSEPGPTETPGPGGSTYTFTPEADAYVRSRRSNSNFGTASFMRLDDNPESNAYVRFDVSGLDGAVESATLRLYVEDDSSIGYDVHAVSDNSWGETTITYNNAPALGSVVGSSGDVGSGVWVEVDVTTAVSGEGLVSFGLSTGDNQFIDLSSRESNDAPELIIETTGSGGGDPTATPVPPTATPDPTETPSPEPTATNTPQPSGDEMQVGDLDGNNPRNGRFWDAVVTITIVDDNGAGVSGATVSGDWAVEGSSADSVSCTTDGSGVCTVTLGSLTRQDNDASFTVTNVTGSLTYNPADNSDPDGDSDGTTISIDRP